MLKQAVCSKSWWTGLCQMQLLMSQLPGHAIRTLCMCNDVLILCMIAVVQYDIFDGDVGKIIHFV